MMADEWMVDSSAALDFQINYNPRERFVNNGPNGEIKLRDLLIDSALNYC